MSTDKRYAFDRIVDGIEEQNGRLQADVARLESEVAELKIQVQTAVCVLLEFSGRLDVGDAELADILADAQMRLEDDGAEERHPWVTGPDDFQPADEGGPP